MERTTILLNEDLKKKAKEELGINNLSAFVEEKIIEELKERERKEKIIKLNYGMLLNLTAATLLFISLLAFFSKNVSVLFGIEIVAIAIIILNALKEVVASA